MYFLSQFVQSISYIPDRSSSAGLSLGFGNSLRKLLLVLNEIFVLYFLNVFCTVCDSLVCVVEIQFMFLSFNGINLVFNCLLRFFFAFLNILFINEILYPLKIAIFFLLYNSL